MDLYRSLVKTRLNYGDVVYHSATRSALKMLDPIHHLGIRLATGAFRTSPVQSLYVESNEWSLNLQRSYDTFTYFLKVNAQPEHPVYPAVNDTQCATLFHNRPTVREPFSLRVRKLNEEMDVSIFTHRVMPPARPFPPWQFQQIDCDISFTETSKHAPQAHIHMHFLELQAKYCCPEFFTDASKSQTGVHYAAIGPSFTDSGALHPETSIFTAEAFALLTAVKHIGQEKLEKSIIFTDSLSVVNAIISLRMNKNPIVIELYTILCTMYASGQHIVLCWVPGHRDIEGNVLADRLATSVHVNASNAPTDVPVMDLKPFLKKKLRTFWQKSWELETHNKLHTIKPYLGSWTSTTKTRHTEVTLCRLRIGHTHSTHAYLLSGDEPPSCDKCGQPLSVLHILLECQELEPLRKKYFPVPFRQQVPLHPVMFLGKDPFFKYECLLRYLKELRSFHVIYTGDP